jgi:hypothetical protein
MYNGTSSYYHNGASIAIDSKDNVHVTWYGDYLTTSYNKLLYKKKNGVSGVWDASPTVINQATGYHYRPNIVTDINDNVHIVWYGYPSPYRIKYREWDAATTSWGSVIQVSTSSSYQYYPTVGTDQRGYVYVTWYGYPSPYTIYLRVDEGTGFGTQEEITSDSSIFYSYQYYPNIIGYGPNCYPKQGAALVWSGYYRDPVTSTTSTPTMFYSTDDFWLGTTYEPTESKVKFSFAVNNVDPEIISDDSVVAIIGDPISINIILSDDGSDDLNFTYDWGDGSGPIFGGQYYNDGGGPDGYPSSLNGTAPCYVYVNLNYTYYNAGTFNLNISVYDDDGGHVNKTIRIKIVGAKELKEEAIKLLEPLVPGRMAIIGYENITLKYTGTEEVTILAYNYVSLPPFSWELRLIYTYCNVTQNDEIFVDASRLDAGIFGKELYLKVFNGTNDLIDTVKIDTVYSCLFKLSVGQKYGDYYITALGEKKGISYKHYSRYALRVEDALDNILFSINKDPRRGYGWWHTHWFYYCGYWLTRDLWIDDARIDPEFGYIVFCEERSAVQNLMEVINNALRAVSVYNMTFQWTGEQKVDIEVYQMHSWWANEWNLSDTFNGVESGDTIFIGYDNDMQNSSIYELGKRILIRIHKYSTGELLDAVYIRTSGYWPLEVEPGNMYGHLKILSSTFRTCFGDLIHWGSWGIRGQGFWKHQFNTATCTRPGHQHVPTHVLIYYLNAIGNYSTMEEYKDLTLQKALSIFEPVDNSVMYDKALLHLLTSWLNLVTNCDPLVDSDGDGKFDMRLSTAIEYAEKVLNDPNSNNSDYARIKNMMEYINENTQNTPIYDPYCSPGWRPWYGDYLPTDTLAWNVSRSIGRGAYNWDNVECWNQSIADDEELRILTNLSSIKMAIKYLVLADDIIARTAYHDATNITVQNESNKDEYDYHIKMAKRYMLRARREADRGRPHRAITDFKLSWKNSVLAVKWALKPENDPNGTSDPGEDHVIPDWDFECLDGGSGCSGCCFNGPWWLWWYVMFSDCNITKSYISGPAGYSKGFWKTNAGKHLGEIHGKPQVNRTTLLKYIKAIADKYGEEHKFLKDLDLRTAYEILSIPRPSCMKDKAEAQILALLLTSMHKGKNYTKAEVTIKCLKYNVCYDGDMSGAIDCILELYENCYYSAAKDIADTLNNIH